MFSSQDLLGMVGLVGVASLAQSPYPRTVLQSWGLCPTLLQPGFQFHFLLPCRNPGSSLAGLRTSSYLVLSPCSCFGLST